MEVAADGALVDGAFSAIFAIVASADQGVPEWLDTRSKVGPPRVVLETDQRATSVIKIGFDEHVADMALRARHAANTEEPGAGQCLAVDGRVALAQKLIA